MSGFVIAIDGTLASGKGSLARRLAQHYGFFHLDTGKLYRSVAADMLRDGKDGNDRAAAVRIAKTLELSDLTNPRLMSDQVGELASRIAVFPELRAALLQEQVQFSKRQPGSVIDGRDIGTVICPDAPVKLFVDASREIRAARRAAELAKLGVSEPLTDILARLKERDERDRSREHSPLMPAPDAHLLDTTDLCIDAAFDTARRIIDSVMSGSRAEDGKET